MGLSAALILVNRLCARCQPRRGGVGLDQVSPAAELRPRGYPRASVPAVRRAIVIAEAARPARLVHPARRNPTPAVAAVPLPVLESVSTSADLAEVDPDPLPRRRGG